MSLDNTVKINLDSDRVVTYSHPMNPYAAATMYISIGIAVSCALAIIFYSGLTHAYMNKLIADPAMARLTADRFFTILGVGGSIGAFFGLTAVAIKVQHGCKGKHQLAFLHPQCTPYTRG